MTTPTDKIAEIRQQISTGWKPTIRQAETLLAELDRVTAQSEWNWRSWQNTIIERDALQSLVDRYTARYGNINGQDHNRPGAKDE